jgi:enamine deaminase RidA (YjgF/YER057c/UK114 family)
MIARSLRYFLGSLGVAGTAVLGRRRLFAAQTAGPEARLKELGITLPTPPTPVATYVPAVRVGNLLFVSGHGPGNAPDGKRYAGKVGRDLSVEQGRAAARTGALNVLASARAPIGSLDKIVRVVKVLGMVNAVPDFTEQPQVINGFADLLVEIFGADKGKGARSAVGMGSLPSNIPVEVEAIFEVRD